MANQNIVSPQAADLILSLRDGDVALLYLYLCRNPSSDREKVSRDLFLPKQRLNEAYERLEMLGMISTPAECPSDDSPAVSVPVASNVSEKAEVPEYTADSSTASPASFSASQYP